jgi:response regulator RpfG family c-di-GMP phosphodiesterase
MKKPIILCVDDEKIVLDSLKKELNTSFKDMLNVEVAESAAEALELLDDLIKDGFEIPIIISDWLMPDMKGDELLIEIHTFLPEARKILLTGQATTQGVGNAVNKAKLYRYIAKPWESEDLDLTVTEAFKSFYKEKKIEAQQMELQELNKNLEKKVIERTKELENSKNEIKEILDKTLKGSVAALINIVSKSNSKVFDKAIRMKDITKRIVLNMGLDSPWEFEISALLSQIGCLDIDKNIVEKFFDGEVINQAEINVFQLHPEKAYEVLKKIPHFENVAEGILGMFSEEKCAEYLFHSSSQALKIGKILRIAHDFDQIRLSGKSEKEIIEMLKRHKSIYDAEVVNALFDVVYTSKSSKSMGKIQSISISGLKIGMILAENVKNPEGKIILNSGEEITQITLMNLIQVKKKNGVEEPIYIYNQ